MYKGHPVVERAPRGYARAEPRQEERREERRPEPRREHRSAPRAARADEEQLEIHLQMCVPDEHGEAHWMIAMREPGAQRGMRLQSLYEDGRTTHYLGTIPKPGSDIVPRQAETIPPQVSSLWACYLVRKLEILGLIPDGQCQRFISDYRHNFDGDLGSDF
ncbi:unnamed protein product [Penicillium bialowiezense]